MGHSRQPCINISDCVSKILLDSDLVMPLIRNKVDEKNVCRGFLRGHCKFGKRCRYKHINPDMQQVGLHGGQILLRSGPSMIS